MDFHYRYTVNAAPALLWNVVSDVPAVSSCIPGAADVAQSGDGAYTGVVKVRVGPVSLALNGKMAVDSFSAEERRIALSGEAADKRVPGSVRVRIKMAVMGKLGEFGQGIIKRKADALMKEFGENVAERVR